MENEEVEEYISAVQKETMSSVAKHAHITPDWQILGVEMGEGEDRDGTEISVRETLPQVLPRCNLRRHQNGVRKGIGKFRMSEASRSSQRNDESWRWC